MIPDAERFHLVSSIAKGRRSMADREPVSAANIAGYDLAALPWEQARAHLEPTSKYFLTTTRPDGQPHVMPVGAVWMDGALYFTSGAAARKSRNIAHDGRCALARAADGMDVVVEGEAERVRDAATLQRVADKFVAHGWPASVQDGALFAEYNAPSAGPPPWEVYKVTLETVYGLGTAEPYGAMRWRF
jgi:hypothetical protein